MKKILFTALAGIVFAMPMNAQFLRGLAEKAIEKKVQEKTTPKQAVEPADNSENTDYITEELQAIVNPEYDTEDSATPMTISSISDVLNKRPALPTVNDLLSPEAKKAYAYKGALAWEQGTMNYRASSQSRYMELQNKILAAGNKQRQQQTRQQNFINEASAKGLMPSQQEIMQALVASGYDLEKITPEQSINVIAGAYSKKWNIPEADVKQFLTLAQSDDRKAEAFLAQIHPDLYKKLAGNAPNSSEFMDVDTKENEYGKLGEQISDLAEEARVLKENMMDMMKHVNYVSSQGNFHVAGLPTNNLEDLYTQIADGWKSSSECKQVIQIETGLQERLNSWEPCVESNMGKDIPFPSWWTQGRKQENAVIATWNKQNAQKWLTAVAEYDGQLRALYERLEVLDKQLEQVRSGDAETFAYLDAKMQVYIAEQLLLDYYSMFSAALGFPCAVPQEETKYMTCETYGKG